MWARGASVGLVAQSLPASSGEAFLAMSDRAGRQIAVAKDSGARRLVLRAPAAHEIDDEANQQHEAKAAATEGRAAEIKAAAAEQEDEHDDQYEWVHDKKISDLGDHSYGELPAQARAIEAAQSERKPNL